MQGSVHCMFNDNAAWQVLPFSALIPQSGVIYIWHGITADLLHLYTDCYALLSADEQTRADSYSQTDDRQRYVIQHGLLRALLGWYLKTAAFAGGYVQGHAGKSYLPDHNIQPCFFNLSGSAGEFLIAIGDTELGVDIAHLKPGFTYHDIASCYFGPDEQAFIRCSENAVDAFFLLWTRKEALLKATGKGIDNDLPRIPSLNGKHPLPDNYNHTDWLTTSFNAGSNSIVSITCRQPVRLQLIHLDAGTMLQGINAIE